ncbi:hypothetical protein DPMN_157666 [Dreissena polymorpha]|uniref:Uncharacterized protein n=1 Tax=Dreissena polymorpha TaxID=45954 RepID=A0A9D4EHP3_DREPO|nr:hypothetical protein DPMN_157666 [Dreissena polymorpha]
MKILKTKSKLHDIKKCENVYVNSDQTDEMRQNSRNLKVLIISLGVLGFKLRGNRLVLEDRKITTKLGNLALPTIVRLVKPIRGNSKVGNAEIIIGIQTLITQTGIVIDQVD